VIGLVLLGGAGVVLGTAEPAPTVFRLLDEFPDGWDDGWKQKTFSDDANEIQVAEEPDGNRALEFDSRGTASGLWRELKVEPLHFGELSWRWKVERCLDGSFDEKTRDGDDYAARVFVIYTSSFLPWRTRAICYVWSSREPAGAAYPNPYTGRVATIVLQSGDENAGEWVSEQRDIVADHVAAFGEPPDKVSGFAVMVDTDNTGTATTTWFDDLVLRVADPMD
jgi:hypothetical protein